MKKNLLLNLHLPIVMTLFFPLAKAEEDKKIVVSLKNKDLDYNYSSPGKEDPFLSPDLSLFVKKIEIDITNALQLFDIKELSFVGFWTSSHGEKKGLLVTPTGESVIVKEGDKIGKNGGDLVTLSQDKMTVREFKLAQNGQRIFEDKEIFFSKDEPIKDISKENSNPQQPAPTTPKEDGEKETSNEMEKALSELQKNKDLTHILDEQKMKSSSPSLEETLKP